MSPDDIILNKLSSGSLKRTYLALLLDKFEQSCNFEKPYGNKYKEVCKHSTQNVTVPFEFSILMKATISFSR
jgi:hypothetical protein